VGCRRRRWGSDWCGCRWCSDRGRRLAVDLLRQHFPSRIALAVAAVKVIPRDEAKPRVRGLDVPGALLATGESRALVYAITQASGAGWGSTQTIGLMTHWSCRPGRVRRGERHAKTPLLRVERLADRAVGGGLFLMVIAASAIFGLFLLCSLYLQNVLGMGPLMTGLAFIPLALAAGNRRPPSGHIAGHHGVRLPLAFAFLMRPAAWPSSRMSAKTGPYLRSVLPGMLVAGFGLASQWSRCRSRF